MIRLTRAELRLKSLGIETPDQIDVLMIAKDMNVKVKFGDLKNCEAKILGVNDKAIVTVSKTVARVRKRFSIAHELGHWCFDRGKCLQCRTDDIGSHKKFNRRDPERIADNYAANLLMPTYLFNPRLKNLRTPNIKVSVELAKVFRVSAVAAAIRTTRLSEHASYMIYVSKNNKSWKISHDILPYGVKLKSNLYDKILSEFNSFDEQGLSNIKDENLYEWFDIEYNPDLFGRVQVYNGGFNHFLVSIICDSSFIISALMKTMNIKPEN